MIWMVISTSIITICAAEDGIILSGLASPNDYPPQRLHYRHDMPTYRQRDLEQYSTNNPMMNNFYKKIQYAPLHGRIGQKSKNTASEYTKVTPSLSSMPSMPTDSSNNKYLYGKEHLEPRLSKEQEPRDPVFKCYSPDHKAEALSTVSRSPGHNAVYRSFLEPIQGDKMYQMNYLTPYNIYRNLNDIPTTMLPFELPHKNARPFLYNKQFNKHYVLNSNVPQGDGLPAQKSKRQFSPYAKFHRLHLNIARVYSPGQLLPDKSPVFADTYSLNLRGVPAHSQGFVPPLVHALGDKNTMLYPKENKYRFRMT